MRRAILARARVSATSAIVPAMLPRPFLPVALVAAVALSAIACSGPGASTAPSASAAPSGAAAPCPASPEPSSEAVSTWSGTQAPSVFPTIIDPGGYLACGQNRMLFSFLDAANVPVAAPDRTVSVALYDLGADPETPVVTTEATFIWAIPDEVGIYAVQADLPTSGLWGAEFTTQLADAAPETIRLTFPVRAERTVVGVGDPAPASDNPTLADVDGDVSRISTDEEPVEAFYEASVADALAAGEPFVLAFATPKFCASSQCGPTLDRLKPIAADHPDLTFINVEPYLLEEVEGQLQPVLTDGQLTAAPATEAWKLPTEPWIFVVDGDGIVTASFMLIASEDELDAAIAALD
jgi:hypothetical protein